MEKSTVDSVLSLDDGRWSHPVDESGVKHEMEDSNFQLGSIKQPKPPPVEAQVDSALLAISPLRVSDIRPGSPSLSKYGLSSSKSYQELHVVSRF